MLELYQEEELLETRPIPTNENKTVFKKITLGIYTIKLSNGRVIWQETIKPEEVIWKYAFPDKDYKMAAATEKEELDNTKSVQLLDGEMNLTVHAGLETGRFVIDLIND